MWGRFFPHKLRDPATWATPPRAQKAWESATWLFGGMLGISIPPKSQVAHPYVAQLNACVYAQINRVVTRFCTQYIFTAEKVCTCPHEDTEQTEYGQRTHNILPYVPRHLIAN